MERIVDTFNSLVHQNDEITNVERLTYLILYHLGEPRARLIGSFEATEHKVIILAWSRMQERYNNKRRIIKNHVHALLDISSTSRVSYILLKHLIFNYYTLKSH